MDKCGRPTAPLIIVACGAPEEAYKFMGGYGNSVDIDVTIAIDHLTLVATEEGLGTCWIGAFDEGARFNKIYFIVSLFSHLWSDMEYVI